MGFRNRSFDFTGSPHISGDVTQPADSKVGTLFALIRANSTTGTRVIFANSNGKQSGSTQEFVFSSTAGGVLQILGRNAASTAILLHNIAGGAALDTWKLVLSSWDLVNGGSRTYINDVDEGAPSTETDDEIDWTRTGYHFGQVNTGSPWLGDIQMFFLNTSTFIDITDAANRRKFYTLDLDIADLGDDGVTPLGTIPDFYYHAPHVTGTVPTNFGSSTNMELLAGTLNSGPGRTSYDISQGGDD